MNFGKYLKELRENAGLTQDEAANKMGVSTTSVQNWEYNNNLPEIDNLNALARTYNIALVELIGILDKSLNKTNDSKQEERKLPYEDLLSDEFNIDIDKIKSLDFSERKKDIFIAFALNISFNNNPLPTLFHQTQTSLEASLFIDKMKELKIIEINSSYKLGYGYNENFSITLSEQGKYMLELIKDNQYFDIYSLNIHQFLLLASKFNLINHLDEKLKLLEFIYKNKPYLIKTVENNGDIYLVDYPFEEYVNNSYSRYRNKCKFVDRLPQILENDYYELIKEESSDEEYLALKNVYLKKLEVYNANKDLLEDMNKPTFNEVYVEYIKLSDKGEKLYNALEECGHYN